MPTHSFILNGEPVRVEAEDDVRMLWVLRDLLGVTGPKYGCGLSVCQACTSHLNGIAVNLCSIPVGQMEPTDNLVTIEGLAGSVGMDLHPAQEIWIEQDVAQCGFCQPGQIMTAVDLVTRANAENRLITDDDLDNLRNVCRCGTYPKVRNAIRALQTSMMATPLTPIEPAVPVAEAQVDAGSTGNNVSTANLPATGLDSVMVPAAAAAGAAVAIRIATRSRDEDLAVED